jgi:hypothetical protein
MAIEMKCSCGKALTLRDELAGKKIRCPKCGGGLEVPDPVEEVEDGEEVETAKAAVRPGAPPPLPGASASSGPTSGDDEDMVEVEAVDEGVSAGPPPLKKWDDGYVAAPPPVAERIKEPKKKKKKKSIYSEMYGQSSKGGKFVFEEGWFGSLGGGIIGGALMIFAAIVLFLILLFIGSLFAYAMLFIIVLFVAGMLSMLKGLMDLYDE